MICARCLDQIADDEEHETYDNPGASAAGCTVFLHVKPCKKTPQQTYPLQRWWLEERW
ncbi:hypothetical protein [Streptomyces sp. CA-106110]|uniref:hypothetical protein n=1 Tax=Streptomyces sp. CA-106110 TaxID=3240044 RepID=UPI003D90BFC0